MPQLTLPSGKPANFKGAALLTRTQPDTPVVVTGFECQWASDFFGLQMVGKDDLAAAYLLFDDPGEMIQLAEAVIDGAERLRDQQLKKRDDEDETETSEA